MNQRRNWIQLKNQFIGGDWITISNFFKENHIKGNSRNRFNTKGWLVKRREYQEEIARRTREQIIEKEIDIRLRQQRHAQQLQTKGLKELQNLPVKRVEDARKLVVSGMEQEREALGMGGKSEANLTQVNVSLPKTRFDEFLEGQNFEGILELIVEIKRERKRRNEEQVEKQ